VKCADRDVKLPVSGAASYECESALLVATELASGAADFVRHSKSQFDPAQEAPQMIDAELTTMPAASATADSCPDDARDQAPSPASEALEHSGNGQHEGQAEASWTAAQLLGGIRNTGSRPAGTAEWTANAEECVRTDFFNFSSMERKSVGALWNNLRYRQLWQLALAVGESQERAQAANCACNEVLDDVGTGSNELRGCLELCANQPVPD
jgi:hypothetical protein